MLTEQYNVPSKAGFREIGSDRYCDGGIVGNDVQGIKNGRTRQLWKLWLVEATEAKYQITDNFIATCNCGR